MVADLIELDIVLKNADILSKDTIQIRFHFLSAAVKFQFLNLQNLIQACTQAKRNAVRVASCSFRFIAFDKSTCEAV